ncbi:MAG: cyclic 2,3-diphosphoglycerate synthase [Methanomassiliicoccales archaeon]|nr:cyclic 2,3-diphosphoglycerate synthase [Methanomassiliicoccales archaeon]
MRVIIMGAAGRDFHNFNTYFRDNPIYEVVAFTATQIPNIEGRRYPSELAGGLYPGGIPIFAEAELSSLIKKHNVEQVVFAYSDISHVEVMHKASLVLASGADFRLMGNSKIVLRSSVPIISVGAVRTGSGKSQTTRKICAILRDRGLDVVAVRHPMPYGDLKKQAVQRFATYDDLIKNECTIEEREEYEPLIDKGIVVYAGVDYGRILREAEKEADVIVWDGGNNDVPFYRSDLHIVVADPHRPGHEMTFHPGETNVRMADVVIINKIQTADRQDILTVRENIKSMNPDATIIEAASPILVDRPDDIRGKRVLVVEDGPTVTHGGMTYGAGTIAAEDYGAEEIIDPRPYAVGSIEEMFRKYPHIGKLLPAMGYGNDQVRELEDTINRADCDVVVSGTPVDLHRVIKVNKPIVRVRYELCEIGHPTLEEIIVDKLGRELKAT